LLADPDADTDAARCMLCWSPAGRWLRMGCAWCSCNASE
jgi:hypothetical protein